MAYVKSVAFGTVALDISEMRWPGTISLLIRYPVCVPTSLLKPGGHPSLLDRLVGAHTHGPPWIRPSLSVSSFSTSTGRLHYCPDPKDICA